MKEDYRNNVLRLSDIESICNAKYKYSKKFNEEELDKDVLNCNKINLFYDYGINQYKELRDRIFKLRKQMLNNTQKESLWAKKISQFKKLDANFELLEKFYHSRFGEDCEVSEYWKQMKELNYRFQEFEVALDKSKENNKFRDTLSVIAFWALETMDVEQVKFFNELVSLMLDETDKKSESDEQFFDNFLLLYQSKRNKEDFLERFNEHFKYYLMGKKGIVTGEFLGQMLTNFDCALKYFSASQVEYFYETWNSEAAFDPSEKKYYVYDPACYYSQEELEDKGYDTEYYPRIPDDWLPEELLEEEISKLKKDYLVKKYLVDYAKDNKLFYTMFLDDKHICFNEEENDLYVEMVNNLKTEVEEVENKILEKEEKRKRELY